MSKGQGPFCAEMCVSRPLYILPKAKSCPHIRQADDIPDVPNLKNFDGLAALEKRATAAVQPQKVDPAQHKFGQASPCLSAVLVRRTCSNGDQPFQRP